MSPAFLRSQTEGEDSRPSDSTPRVPSPPPVETQDEPRPSSSTQTQIDPIMFMQQQMLMQQQIMELMTMMREERRERMATGQTPANEVESSPSPSPSRLPSLIPAREPRIHDPDTFNGRKPDELNKFVMQCNLVFDLQPSTYTTERIKVAYMISYLRGMAADAIQPLVGISPTPYELSTVVDFVEFLRSNFGDPDEKGSAATKLDELVQNHTAAEYFARFREIIAVLGWREQEQLVHRAKKGLNSELQDEMARCGRNFYTLDELIGYIVPLDNRIRVRDNNKKSEGRRREDSRNPGGKSFLSSSSTTTRTAYPAGQQETSTTSTTSRPPFAPSSRPPFQARPNGPGSFKPFIPGLRPNGHISDEERDRRRRENLCFRCGSKDHGIQECTLTRYSPTNAQTSSTTARPADPKA